jgi:hypothetical protein
MKLSPIDRKLMIKFLPRFVALGLNFLPRLLKFLVLPEDKWEQYADELEAKFGAAADKLCDEADEMEKRLMEEAICLQCGGNHYGDDEYYEGEIHQ